MTPRDRLLMSFALASDRPALSPTGCDAMPFQRAGVEYGSSLRDVIIGDEMGLGKTIQALCLANEWRVPRLLVVCPASLRMNWKREAAKWLIYSPDLLVLSYDELVRQPDRGNGSWPMLIVDEAQYCKNPEAQRTAAALGVRADRRVFLSGTPIINRPIEFWPLLATIDPQTWGDRHAYGLQYCGGQWDTAKQEWDYKGATNLKELQGRLRSTCFVRRLKADVLKDLPAKVRQIIELPASQIGISDHWLREVRQLYKAKVSAYTPEAVHALKESQQRVFENLAKVRHEQALLKVPAVAAHVVDVLDSERKVVVFAHHRDVLEALNESLAAFNPVMVRGGMTDQAKQRAVDWFQEGPTNRVFLGQLQAAGTGLTLTAARHVVFAEIDWSPATMAQAEDRCHRIGQRDTVLVQHLVLDRSVDAIISRAILKKQQVVNQTLNGGTDLLGVFDWVTALALEA